MPFLGIDHGPPVSSGPGWNDPPPAALAMANKPKAVPKTVNAITSPITSPLGLAEPSQSQAPPMNFGGHQQQGYYHQQQAYGDQGSYGQVAAPPPPMTMMQPQPQQPYGVPQDPMLLHDPKQQQQQQQGFQGYQGFQPAAQPTAAAPPAPAPEPPKPVVKGPIPAEHQILKEVFDTLKDKCLASASHPVREIIS